MAGSQSGRGGARDGAHGSRPSIQRAVEPRVTAGLLAHVSVAGLTLLHVQPPLVTALVATLVFAGVSLTYGRRAGALIGPSPGRPLASLLADAIVLVVVAALAWLIGRGLGAGAAFYCEPLVPWRIEIALGGSFGVACVTVLACQRSRAWAAYPLIVLALFWIAPFYGFFSAPLFLAVSLNTMCPGRSIASVALVTVGLRVGEQVGLGAAGWISGGVPPRGGA